MLGSASSLTGCSWIPVFYMERLPIWPPQPSYWATRYLLVRLDVRLSGFWLSVTTVKDLRMTAGTNGFTCFPRHGGVTPAPTSKLRATTEKFLMEKPNNTFCPTWELNPGPRTHQSRLWPRDQRGSQVKWYLLMYTQVVYSAKITLGKFRCVCLR